MEVATLVVLIALFVTAGISLTIMAIDLVRADDWGLHRGAESPQRRSPSAADAARAHPAHAEPSLTELARLGPAQRAEAIRRRPPEVDMDELQLWELGTAADWDKVE